MVHDIARLINKHNDTSFFYIITNYIIDLDSYVKALKEDPELIAWALTE